MDMIKLINLVRGYTNLWDKKCREYCNRELSKATWNLISEELNISADLCKSKWCNLRDTFRKEYNKTLEHRDGGAQIPKWKFYNEMLFLLDQLGPPRENNSAGSGYVGYIEVKSENQEDQSSDKEQLLMTVSNDDNDQDPFEQTSPITFTPKRIPIRRNRKRSIVRMNENIEQRLLKLRKTKLQIRKDNMNDSDRMFLLSLLPYLKKFSDEKKLLIRHKIQGVILEEMSIESNQTRNEMVINLHPSQFSPSTIDSHPSTHTSATNFPHQDNSEMYTNSNNLQRDSTNYFENAPLTNIKFENSMSLLDSK